MTLINGFTDSTPGGDETTPKSEVLPVSSGSTDAFLRITNTGGEPCNFYYRTPGATAFYLLQINPSVSSDIWFNLTATHAIEYYFDAGALQIDIAYFLGTALVASSALVEADIENELQIALPAGYSVAYVASICTWAEDMVKLKTRRTTFTGSATTVWKYAALCFAIDRIVTSAPKLVAMAISSISEAGGSISFRNGKDLNSYRKEAELICNDLRLPGTTNYTVTWPDLNSDHTSTDGSLLY